MTDLDNRMAIQRLEMNAILYGDGAPRSRTWSERLSMRVYVYRQRISDAWLVLTGKAYIGDCD